jgi:hypothetical protein
MHQNDVAVMHAQGDSIIIKTFLDRIFALQKVYEERKVGPLF